MDRVIARLAIAGLLFLTSCVQFNRITGPVSGCIRRAAIISVDIPPITLTPSRTAAERQLIGENKELEKHGWMIASARSSKQITETDESISHEAEIDGAREYFKEMSVIEFYHDLLMDYRASGILGESYNGHVIPVPLRLIPRDTRMGSGEELNNAKLIAAEINLSRDKLRKILKENRADFMKEIPDLGRESLNPGEWFYTSESKWVQIR